MTALRPSLWPSPLEAQLRRALDLSEIQNRELKALVVRLSEMVLRHVMEKSKAA
jgi:hypothetical protein